jgi:hypothetical protein
MPTAPEAPNTNPYKIADINIDLTKVAWIFVSASFDDRHLYDLIWCWEALKHRNVPIDNVFFFVNYPSPDSFFQPFGLEKRIYNLGDFSSAEKIVGSFEHAFLITSGHGSVRGLENKGSKDLIPPHLLLETIRKISGLQRGFFILGQCYGGIFDGLEAAKKPEIGLMGASRLSTSVSSGIPSQNHYFKIRGPRIDPEGKSVVVDIHWAANPFLFHFFSWIRDPIDTDGDKKLTLLDAYKYAGSKTNDDVRMMRVLWSLELNSKYSVAKTKLQKHLKNEHALDPVEVETQFSLLQEEAAFLYFHQEPWILHTNLVRASTMKP